MTNTMYTLSAKHKLLTKVLIMGSLSFSYGKSISTGVKVIIEKGASEDSISVHHDTTQRHIELKEIRAVYVDADKDNKFFRLRGTTEKDFDMAVKKTEEKQTASDKKEEAKVLPEKKVNRLETEDQNPIRYSTDKKWTEKTREYFRATNYTDTVKHLFNDNSELLLEGHINKIYTYEMNSYSKPENYSRKVNMLITWVVRNTYDELLDSFTVSGWSGMYKSEEYEDYVSAYPEAIQGSFRKLLQNAGFKIYLNQETVPQAPGLKLTIAKPLSGAVDVEEGTLASVTIKRKSGGHASGFFISNDGYIVTNYSVLSGENVSKQSDIKVILSDGEEVPVSIVRFNRNQNIALLKVDKKIEKPFILNSAKTYKKLMVVYTVGTPKSIELGQSVSTGLISNERKAYGSTLLQLSMKINSGNSGGPLFDKEGNLHGIIVSKLVGYATEGVGFAIPAHKVAEYLNVEIK